MLITLPPGDYVLVCACGVKLRGQSILAAHLPICDSFITAAETLGQDVFVADEVVSDEATVDREPPVNHQPDRLFRSRNEKQPSLLNNNPQKCLELPPETLGSINQRFLEKLQSPQKNAEKNMNKIAISQGKISSSNALTSKLPIVVCKTSIQNHLSIIKYENNESIHFINTESDAVSRENDDEEKLIYSEPELDDQNFIYDETEFNYGNEIMLTSTIKEETEEKNNEEETKVDEVIQQFDKYKSSPEVKQLNKSKLFITTKDGRRIPIKVKSENTETNEEVKSESIQAHEDVQLCDTSSIANDTVDIKKEQDHVQCLLCGEMVLKESFDKHKHKWKPIDPAMKRPSCPARSSKVRRPILNNPKSKWKNQRIQCQYCDFTTSRGYYYTHLKKMHPEVKKRSKHQIKCVYCGELLRAGCHIKMHYEKNHPDLTNPQKSCVHCGVVYKSAKERSKHRKLHSNVECDICLRKFSYTSGLKNHMIIHTEEKPFRCNECGKEFNAIVNLKKHQNIHKGIRFKCPICPGDFSQKDGVKCHIDAVHFNKPQKPRNRLLRPKVSKDSLDNTRTKATSSRKHSDAYTKILHTLETARAAESNESVNAITNNYVF